MIIIPEQWIKEPDERGDGFLEAWAECFPMPIETHNVALSDVTLNTKQNFDFIFEGAQDIEVYADENDYLCKRGSNLASECFVPAGLFSPTNDKDFVQTPRAIVCGKVIETYNPTEYGFEPDDIIFTLGCLGNEFNAVIYKKQVKIKKLEAGNYVFGIFWIEGWPDEDDNR